MKRATKTLKFTELHAWRQDNPYILTGYRPNLPSMVACLKSIFAYFTMKQSQSLLHVWPIGLHWHRLVDRWLLLPVCILWVFLSRKMIAAYLILITTLGAFATYTVVSPAYRSNSGRRNRTIVFVALGLSGIFPVTHGILSHGLLDAADRVGLWWLLGSGAMYIIGAIFYAERFPERLTPGSFDLIGSNISRIDSHCCCNALHVGLEGIHLRAQSSKF
ncbi:hypothetical protein H4Q26_015335 [Puccinia striiformis f. sp. tritici PST-130]|nr:hypothetical protein H4Q26_015335 [Puccinia striiformis f. sp. tritici PST-130]